MMHEVPDLSERELRALERGRQKAELIAWLRKEAAARDGKMAWYVARTNCRADSVARELRDNGIEAVCPLERRWKRYPRSRKQYPVEIPVFGKYVFVRTLMAESAWVGVLTFEGISCLQGSGERPIPLAPTEEAQLLVRVAELADMIVRNASEIEKGDRVIHPVGKFAELAGTVLEINESKREALVSTMLFGREIETRCGIDDLEKLG